MRHRQDADFMSETDGVLWEGVHPSSHMILIVGSLFVLFALGWSYMAPLDEVTTGSGRVIPSGQVQVVQNLEGGILSELLVKEGDVVDKDTLLLRLSDTQSSSSFRENHTRYLALIAQEARLQAEANGADRFASPEAVVREQPALAKSEQELFSSRLHSLHNSSEMLSKAVEQKEQELVELRAATEQNTRKLELVRKELAITEPMVQKRIMSELELLRLRREAAEIESVLQANELALPRIEAALGEAKRKAREPGLNYRNQALVELNQVKAERASLLESMTALEDRVTRTVVRSPVHGSVIRVKVNTMGQVIRPGMDLVEIMPLEKSLLVEAKIRPADIAFLRPGLKTIVKFTAYDFSIYGGLPGTLEQISADTITDDKGEHYYQIQVRTDHNHLGTPEHPLPIMAGMVVTVDILTGKKTVLDYLLKPILKAKANAMRER